MLLNGGRIGVTYNIQRLYWFSDETLSIRSDPQPILQVFSQNTDDGDELEIEITETLQYILGLKKIIVHPLVTKYKSEFLMSAAIQGVDQATIYRYNWFYFMNKANKQGDNSFACSYMGKFLPDIWYTSTFKILLLNPCDTQLNMGKQRGGSIISSDIRKWIESVAKRFPKKKKKLDY